jgi:hypothetical protein
VNSERFVEAFKVAREEARKACKHYVEALR